MSLLYLSDHTFAVYRSEHTFRLDEIDDEDEEEVDETDDESYLEVIGGVRTRRFVEADLDDDWSSSATSVGMFTDKCSTPGIARPAKSFELSPPVQDRFCLSSHKQPCGSKVLASTVSLDKSRTIAALLHESLGDILSSSQRDVGISALGKVARNIHSLASVESKDVQKEKLADLLTEETCGFHGPEHRRSGPRSAYQQSMTMEQQNQLVNAIAEAFSKIEVLIAAEDDESIQGSYPKEATKAPQASRADKGKNTLSCPSDNRRPSCYSDISSITSCTSTTLNYESPSLHLHGSNSPPRNATAAASKSTPTKLLGEYLGVVALQDSFSTVRSLDSGEDASPKRPQRHLSTRDLALQDSFTSFGSLDSDDDKAPSRPQRSGSSLSGTSKDDAGVVVAPHEGSPRRPGGRRTADVRAAPPRRQRSFDEC